MSERALVQTQQAADPQPVVQEASLQRRDRDRTAHTTPPQWAWAGGFGTFADPRVSFDFSAISAFSGLETPARPVLFTGMRLQAFSRDPASVEGSTDTRAVPSSSLLVEDSVSTLASGQMRRSEFLERMRAEITRTVDAALTGTGRTTDGCPYIRYWFDVYSRRDSVRIERALHRYAPETVNASTALQYISITARRVRAAAEKWVRNGEVTGIPGGISTSLSGEPPLEPEPVGAHEQHEDSPRAIQRQLGEGRPLDSRVRSRMESAFGMDFGYVRAHTGADAAVLSRRVKARAFTLGNHVAFGENEYRPGTLVGDAVIAHELAHVVQQQGADSGTSPVPMGKETTNYTHYDALETDADVAAAGVIASLWGRSKTYLATVTGEALPRLRSGLRLQRCGGCDSCESEVEQAQTQPEPQPNESEAKQAAVAPRSVFSELSTQDHMGYDAGITPNGLVVPVGGTRGAALDNPGDAMTFSNDTPAVATVARNNDTLTVTGAAHGSATITAVESGQTIDTLEVSVKRRVDKTVNYHFVSDNAGHTTTRSQGDETALTDSLQLWGNQANVHFQTGAAAPLQINQDLGDAVVWSRGAGNEWNIVTGHATAPDWNVFLVWEYRQSTDANAGTLGGNTLLEDDVCDDGLTLAHEAGHFRGRRGHNTRGVMGVCGDPDRPRVPKADADTVNT
jgi:hypothetical protein